MSQYINELGMEEIKESKMKITLSNDFHNTEVTLMMKSIFPTRHQVKRAKAALCGISGCTCSGVLGNRGEQNAIIGEKQEYDGADLIPSVRPK